MSCFLKCATPCKQTGKLKRAGVIQTETIQFIFINDKVKRFQEAGEPVISVDTKKKEIVGEFPNKGSTWRPQGCPERVNIYDFLDPDKGRASLYGIYDLANNVGFVNVGISADTSAFAAESIRRWWLSMGKESYPNATRLLITVDGGGSKWIARKTMESRTSAFCRRDKPGNICLSFSSRNKQVE